MSHESQHVARVTHVIVLDSLSFEFASSSEFANESVQNGGNDSCHNTLKTMICKAIFVALYAFVASIAGASSASVSGYETKERLRGSTAEADRELIALDGSVSGCIELKNGNTAAGAKLVFGNCNRRINGFDYRDLGNTTDLVQLYSRKDKTMCMEAKPLEEGAYVRLQKCSKTNKYQKFEWISQIKPASDKSLCVAYHGQHADIGDYIKLKKCTKFQDGWSED